MGMNLLRSTHQETQMSQGFPVVLEVSHLRATDINLLYSLIEIWLYQNCKDQWTLEQIEETRSPDHTTHHYIRLVFQDPREAIFYKLSPSYLHNRSVLPLFLTNLSYLISANR